MAKTSSHVPGRAGAAEHNLLVPLSSLVGRGRELDGIVAALRRTRLVTLTGPGGVGKTSLALEVARHQLARRSDGVWFVDLAASAGAPDVAGETARVMKVGTPAGATATDALRRYLADRDVLLILDNCEHVVEACAELAASLLSSCGRLRLLATSREILGVAGETVWTVQPLELEDARRLFVERARQRRPGFMPDEHTDATTDGLCARLDRLPLAIELAAARIGVMSVQEIAASLDARLGELAATARHASPRHQTLRAVVEWSYQLLTPAEQQAFRGLGVFVGGFDADAATSVAAELSLARLARLVDKSLVAVVESRPGRTRYRLLETVREYAHELLVECGELDGARERHLRHYSALAAIPPDGWPSTRAPQFISERRDDYENVRAALEWAIDSDACEARSLFSGTQDLFMLLGHADGLRLAQLLLDRCPAQDRLRVEVLISAGLLAILIADTEAAARMLTEARELSAELEERALEGWARFFLGLGETFVGAIEPGRANLQAARSLHRDLGVRGEALATAALGIGFLIDGQPDRARELIEEALALNRARDDDWGEGQCQVYLGILAEDTGAHPDRVSEHYRRAIELHGPYGGGPLLPVALVGQGGVVGRRNPRRGLQVVAAAYALRARRGGKFAPYFLTRTEPIRLALTTALGAEAPRVWDEGSRLGLDEAIVLAFGTGPPPADTPAGLSHREAEVTSLVARGLSNKAIAAKLHLSVRTVESHVQHTLAKTRLANRTQLATWARERIQMR
ncbi:MAG TPA: LuxR C-terminal-related transcriptional regulator [Solirubrobacteraceae bacterium]|nr:LuxR C-terminal-related transcriptional regulator [Solirubrobacteraceae bacterium]